MEKQRRALVEQLKQPKNILILVFLTGVLINGSLYIYRIMPQTLPMHNLSVEYNQLEKQRKNLEKLPIPERISPDKINHLVKQVPISEHTAAFLLGLKDLEALSGVVIELISDGSNSKIDAANELITAQGKANLPNASYNTQPKATAVPGTEANLNEQGFEISIVGHYTQLIDFINRLKEMPRIVNVKEWKFGDVSTLTDVKSLMGQIIAPASNLPATDTSEKRITVKLSIYSASLFKNKFPDLPPVSVTAAPENRLDPTIPDKQFNELLNSR